MSSYIFDSFHNLFSSFDKHPALQFFAFFLDFTVYRSLYYSHSLCPTATISFSVRKTKQHHESGTLNLVAFLCVVYIERLSPSFVFHICASSHLLKKKCHYAFTFTVFVFGFSVDATAYIKLHNDAMCSIMVAFSFLIWTKIDAMFSCWKRMFSILPLWIQAPIRFICYVSYCRLRSQHKIHKYLLIVEWTVIISMALPKRRYTYKR